MVFRPISLACCLLVGFGLSARAEDLTCPESYSYLGESLSSDARFSDKVFDPHLDAFQRFDQMNPPRKGRIKKIGHEVREEIGVVEKSHHPRVQEMIEKLRAYEGELLVQSVVDSRSKKAPRHSIIHFTFETEPLVPKIVITPNATLSDVEHEFTHFEDWVAVLERYKEMGLSESEINRRMNELGKDTDFRQMTETRAVAKQIQTFSRQDQLRGQRKKERDVTIPTRALSFADIDSFIDIETYPQREVLSSLLPKDGEKIPPKSLKKANEAIDLAIKKAMLIRRAAFRRATAELEKDPNAKRIRFLEQFSSEQVDMTHLFDQIFGNGEKFKADGKYKSLRTLFSVRKKESISKLTKGKKNDAFWSQVSNELSTAATGAKERR